MRRKDGKASPARAPNGVSEYTPPCTVLLDGLRVSNPDIQGNGMVSVSRAFLRALIGEFMSRGYFDEEWYAQHYPDVDAARLAGDVASLLEHYKRSGYFEGRLPAEPPFDAAWYRQQYKDIATAFPPSDVDGMRTHFLEGGYLEGRAGTAEAFEVAECWRALIESSK